MHPSTGFIARSMPKIADVADERISSVTPRYILALVLHIQSRQYASLQPTAAHTGFISAARTGHARCTNPPANRAPRGATDVRANRIRVLHRQAKGGPPARTRLPLPPARPSVQRRNPRPHPIPRQPV